MSSPTEAFCVFDRLPAHLVVVEFIVGVDTTAMPSFIVSSSLVNPATVSVVVNEEGAAAAAAAIQRSHLWIFVDGFKNCPNLSWISKRLGLLSSTIDSNDGDGRCSNRVTWGILAIGCDCSIAIQIEACFTVVFSSPWTLLHRQFLARNSVNTKVAICQSNTLRRHGFDWHLHKCNARLQCSFRAPLLHRALHYKNRLLSSTTQHVVRHVLQKLGITVPGVASKVCAKNLQSSSSPTAVLVSSRRWCSSQLTTYWRLEGWTIMISESNKKGQQETGRCVWCSLDLDFQFLSFIVDCINALHRLTTNVIDGVDINSILFCYSCHADYDVKLKQQECWATTARRSLCFSSSTKLQWNIWMLGIRRSHFPKKTF